MALPFPPIIAKLLVPLLPYVAAFGAGWFIQGHRMDAGRIQAELKAKDLAVEQAKIRAQAATELAASKDQIIAEYREAKEGSEARERQLEANLTDLALRQPKDTTRIIDNTNRLADDLIAQDQSNDWLHNPYPAIMLNNANRRIAASKDYSLPVAPLAGRYPTEPEP